jgi:stage III sporulation protein AA
MVTVSFSEGLIKTEEKDLQEIVFSLSRRSLHTYQDMIAKGFIPLRNGCKAGVAGRAVMKNGSVYSVSSFNSVNIRVSREFYGCSCDLLSKIGMDCTSFLIVGAPLSGKTTLIRDLCRHFSGGNVLNPLKTAIIDERDEIASRSFGVGADVGVHTDVLTLYPKAVGTEIAVRTLSPDIIVLDEIGTEEEARAMLSGMNSGVSFIATAHGSSFEEVLRRPNIKRLINAKVFQKVVVLEGKNAPCKVKELISL